MTERKLPNHELASAAVGNDSIRMFKVRVHNLQGFDLALPLGKLIVVTGVSGSGKSSLAIDALHAEGQRRYLDAFPLHVRQRLPRIDKPEVERIENVPPSIAVGQRIAIDDSATVLSVAGLLAAFRVLFARGCEVWCTQCGSEVIRTGPAAVARKLAMTAGDGPVTIAFPLAKMEAEVWSEQISHLAESGFIRLEIDGAPVRLDAKPLPCPPSPNASVRVLVDRVAATHDNLGRLAEAFELAFAKGDGSAEAQFGGEWHAYSAKRICLKCGIEYTEASPRVFHPDNANEVSLQAYRLLGADFRAWLDRPLGTLAATFAKHVDMFAERGLATPMRQIRSRLDFLLQVGLSYLSLGRLARTLSGGELRRVALAAAFGANLSKMLYVLDEPTAGLHPVDTVRLIHALRQLQRGSNTVVVVEHDFAVIDAADHVVELGPGAGARGGQVTYEGAAAGLPGERLTLSRNKRKPRGVIRLIGASANNLQNVDVNFPLGCLCGVCGPSGAGKSSLVIDALIPAFETAKSQGEPDAPARWQRFDNAQLIDEIVLVDGNAVGRSIRANAATYIKIFDEIRTLFSETMDAKISGLAPGDFSFNVDGGRCEHCQGLGVLTVNMQFLNDVSVVCPVCNGRRFQRRILDVKFRGLDIAQVLDLTARDAFGFFRNQPRIQDRLHWLIQVGLEYLRIGQPLATLSGGEAQRLKIALALGVRGNKRSLFVFDEPTIGLHEKDVGRLLECFDALLAVGHSIIAIEHDPHFLAAADWLIELGPGAGPEGGRLVAQGTPRELVAARS